MSKNIEYQLFVGINEDVASAALPTLNGNIIEDYGKQYMVTNIEFEAIVPSNKK